MEKSFENIVGIGENAGNLHFSFSYNVFYPIKDKSKQLSNIYSVDCKRFQFEEVQGFFLVWSRANTTSKGMGNKDLFFSSVEKTSLENGIILTTFSFSNIFFQALKVPGT